MAHPADSVDRRSFCVACAAGLGALACGGGGGGSTPVTGGGTPPPSTTVVTTQESKSTMLGSAAGTVKDYRTPGKFFLVRDAKGIFAVSSTCTHQGCTVNPGTSTAFLCPCHGSSYDLNGGNLGGPAPSPLPHFEVKESTPGGMLQVDPSKTVAADLRLA